ncbi:MAG: hypothetical protein Q7R41_10650 [Phycisphaerales bacterium]|nr:hypothetical protein [Phycisphaerales bacterium]
MRFSPFTTRVLIGLAVLGGIAVLRFKPWRAGAVIDAGQRESLTVGFLPVT